MSKLPNSWTEAFVSDICEVVMGQAPPGASTNYERKGTPFVKAGEFRSERPVIREWTTQPLKLAKRGDVLVCVVGATAGKVNLGVDCAIGRSVAALRPRPGVDQRYLYAFMQTRVAALRRGATGTAQSVISAAMLGSLRIPLPPEAEQKRIVDRLGRLTGQTNVARQMLAVVPSQIARYRSAVLHRAFSGELTSDLRPEGHRGVPEGWRTTTLGEVADIQGGIQVGRKRKDDEKLVEVPYLRVANVQRGWLNLAEVKTISVTLQERDRLALRVGDVLMNEGGDRDKLGRGWVWNGQIPVCIHQNHVFRVRMKPGVSPAEYVSHFANEMGQSYFLDQGTQTTNLASISKRKVAALPIVLPPFDEAVEIAKRIREAFASADRVADETSAAVALLDRLDAALVARALRGELEPQDIDEEPAQTLLERIRLESARAAVQPKSKERKSIRREAVMASSTTLESALASAVDWLTADEAFRLCGAVDGAETETVERLYEELRQLDKAGRLQVQKVADSEGRKLHDLIRLKAA